ncbi:MAG TPA: chorismate mutase [Spirochaetales bacterium]|nr:chorismate mutase [Spirochaetales bacterium]HQG40318.1 chorismate mutase [Spirochaetales bacterium]HQK34802.1 chorismate mutase [Spirochaetales bacterium]
MIFRNAITVLRGAVFVKDDSPKEIDRVTQVLLNRLVEHNSLKHKRILAMIFSVTNDIQSKNPATAVREAGYEVPLFCVQEAQFKNAPRLCIRVILWYQGKIKKPVHVYCEGAEILRPDLMIPNN